MERLEESMHKKITIADIADDLGVSKTTVSRAISGKGRVGKETREKVLVYIKQHNYTPNVIAKSLAQSKTFNVAVVLPADSNLTELPFFQSCLLGVCEMASSLDYDVVVTAVADDNISKLTRIINNHKVDGVILTRSLVHDLSSDYLKKMRIPYVVIGSSEDEDVIQIDNYHEEACKELTSLLLMQGLKRITLIGGNLEHVVNQNRYKGFREAYAKHGLKVQEELVRLDIGSKIQTEQAVKELLEKDADCILCMDDYLCSNVLNRLNQEKKQVPEDVKVASYYSSVFLENYNPPITSIRFDVKELGSKACEVLIDRLMGRETLNKTFLGYEIILRDSTRC